MKAVITGSAGFIGSWLSERLVADGWSVVGVDSFTRYYDPDDKRRNLAGLTSEPHFDLVETDVVSDEFARLLRGRPVVFHLAAQPGVRKSFGDGFRRYLHDNVLATQRVFEAALDAGCPRVVYASSSSVYGEGPATPFHEDTTPTEPRSPYGVTKLACERLAEVYRHLGLDVVGLRYFTVYGPRQRPDMAIRRLCRAALDGTPFPLKGDGRQSRDFTYVDDAVDATVRAMLATEPDPVLNIGGGEESSLAGLIEAVESLAGRTVSVVRSHAAAGDVSRTHADTTRARTSLGWRPLVGLDQGLRSELAWVARTAPGPARGPARRPGGARVMHRHPPARVAVVVSGWPRRSETFALNELLALRRAGVLAAVFATKPGESGLRHPAADDLEPAVATSGRTPDEQADELAARLAGTGITAVHGYFAHTAGRGRDRRRPRLGVPYGFSVHALDARKVADRRAGRPRRASAVGRARLQPRRGRRRSPRPAYARGCSRTASTSTRFPATPPPASEPTAAARGRPARREEGLRRAARGASRGRAPVPPAHRRRRPAARGARSTTHAGSGSTTG